MNADLLIICILSVICILASITNYRLIKTRDRLIKEKSTKILEDLDLATSDQLFTELRKRQGSPYIILTPVKTEDIMGLNVEIHNLPPIVSIQVLKLAASITTRELANRGFSVDNDDVLPEFPDDLFNNN